MTEWKRYDAIWMVSNEQLAPDRWLLCFRRHSDDATLPEAWVNITTELWPQDRMVRTIEEHALSNCGPLELECIMIEMRKKYGAGDGTV